MNGCKFSIVFSARNRYEQISYALPSILSMYEDRDDIEIVCMDDHSSDGTLTKISNLENNNPKWKNRLSISTSCRQSREYDTKQNQQTNYLVNLARGEYIVLQSAEIAYVDNIVDDLAKFCSDRHVVFAHVLNSEKPPSRDYFALQKLNRSKRVLHLVFPGLLVDFDHTTYNSLLYQDTPVGKTELNYENYEKQNKTQSPRYTIIEDGITYSYLEYTGPLRPIPFFFCGMIKKSDFLSVGGYPDILPVDVNFGNCLSHNSFKFTFTSSLAIHINHDRV